MPPTNRIWTLNDVAGGNNGGGSNSCQKEWMLPLSRYLAMAKLNFLKCCHILSLLADQAKTLLELSFRI
jgi:hypothetical protein